MRRERGLSIVTAVFILLILAALAAAILRMGMNEQSESAIDVNASRAYQAARAGLEYGAYRAVVVGGAAGCVTTSLSGTTALNGLPTGFAVTVACTTLGPYDEAGAAKTLYRIVANACNQPVGAGTTCPNPAPGANYVERELQMTAINPP